MKKNSLVLDCLLILHKMYKCKLRYKRREMIFYEKKNYFHGCVHIRVCTFREKVF